MNAIRNPLIWLTLVAMLIVIGLNAAFGQDTNAPGNAPALVGEGITGTIIQLAEKYPVVASLLILLGSLRLFIKPLMAGLHFWVASTESKKDDEILAKVEHSWLYTAFLFLLDWLTSIKLKPAQTQDARPKTSPLVVLLAGLAISLTACKSPEHAMLATAQAQHQTVKSALKQWNAYLGTEIVRIKAMNPDDALHRTQELRDMELKVSAALDEYNRAVATARIAVDSYFDIKAGLNSTNAPPDLGGHVIAYLDAITEAETAILNLISLYAK